MSLGSSLFQARKKSGLSQEEVAGKLGVSRQTISKWELDETLPDIRQSKKLSNLYHLTLDELIDFDIEQKEIEEAIERVSEETQKKIRPCLKNVNKPKQRIFSRHTALIFLAIHKVLLRQIALSGEKISRRWAHFQFSNRT